MDMKPHVISKSHAWSVQNDFVVAIGSRYHPKLTMESRFKSPARRNEGDISGFVADDVSYVSS